MSNAHCFSAETLALYKSVTCLLIYLLLDVSHNRVGIGLDLLFARMTIVFWWTRPSPDPVDWSFRQSVALTLVSILVQQSTTPAQLPSTYCLSSNVRRTVCLSLNLRCIHIVVIMQCKRPFGPFVFLCLICLFFSVLFLFVSVSWYGPHCLIQMNE